MKQSHTHSVHICIQVVN